MQKNFIVLFFICAITTRTYLNEFYNQVKTILKEQYIKEQPCFDYNIFLYKTTYMKGLSELLWNFNETCKVIYIEYDPRLIEDNFLHKLIQNINLDQMGDCIYYNIKIKKKIFHSECTLETFLMNNNKGIHIFLKGSPNKYQILHIIKTIEKNLNFLSGEKYTNLNTNAKRYEKENIKLRQDQTRKLKECYSITDENNKKFDSLLAQHPYDYGEKIGATTKRIHPPSSELINLYDLYRENSDSHKKSPMLICYLISTNEKVTNNYINYLSENMSFLKQIHDVIYHKICTNIVNIDQNDKNESEKSEKMIFEKKFKLNDNVFECQDIVPLLNYKFNIHHFNDVKRPYLLKLKKYFFKNNFRRTPKSKKRILPLFVDFENLQFYISFNYIENRKNIVSKYANSLIYKFNLYDKTNGQYLEFYFVFSKRKKYLKGICDIKNRKAKKYSVDIFLRNLKTFLNGRTFCYTKNTDCFLVNESSFLPKHQRKLHIIYNHQRLISTKQKIIDFYKDFKLEYYILEPLNKETTKSIAAHKFLHCTDFDSFNLHEGEISYRKRIYSLKDLDAPCTVYILIINEDEVIFEHTLQVVGLKQYIFN